MDYSSLKASISDWMVRSDLATVLDDFIDFAEARLNREQRLRGMETALSETIAIGVISVPSDYVELKHAYIDGTPVSALERVDADKIYQDFPYRTPTATPTCIAREGSSFIFGPYPNSGYTVKGIYYAAIASLSATTTTNWWTDNEPDLLLAACCVEASRYVKDVDSLMLWEGRYKELSAEVKKKEKREQFSGRGLSMRLG